MIFNRTELIFKTGNIKGSAVVAFEGIKLEKQRLTCSNSWRIINGSCGGYRGSGSHTQVRMGRPCGKNEPAQMGKGYISVGRKIR